MVVVCQKVGRGSHGKIIPFKVQYPVNNGTKHRINVHKIPYMHTKYYVKKVKTPAKMCIKVCESDNKVSKKV